MAKSKSSVNRIISQFRNVDISVISIVAVSKDVNVIKQNLNKPSLSDKTALAYQRLASQYLNLIAKPTILEQKIVKTQFKIDINANYQDNLVKLHNRKPIGTGYIGLNIKDRIQALIGIRPTNIRKGLKVVFRNLNWKGSFQYLKDSLMQLDSILNEIANSGYKECRIFFKHEGYVNNAKGVLYTSSKIEVIGDFLQLLNTIEENSEIVDNFDYVDIGGVIYKRIHILWSGLEFYR